MIKINSVLEMRQAASSWRAEGKTVAFVPTSGSLHEGHKAMIDAALSKAQVVVVSLFVNPLQFGPSEHLVNYPRPTEADVAICEAKGVQAVFMPTVEDVLPHGFSSFVTEEAVAKPLCGVSRPAHFRGVITVLAKFLNLIQPRFLVMGMKDAQTVAVVRKMISDLCFDTELVTVPNVRDADGLSCHVHNRDLTSTQRKEALSLPEAIKRAAEMVASGQKSVDRVVAEVTHILRQHRRVRVIHIAIVDPVTMEPVRELIPGKSLLSIAVWVDEIRLTDNAML
jgi:pantoate--beta-alanine ligase